MEYKRFESIKNWLFLIKTNRRLQLVTLGVGASVIIGGSVLISSFSLKNNDAQNTESTPVSLIDSAASNSGEVAGVSTDKLISTPSPTPIKSKRTPSPTPTPTSKPNNSGQAPSNNNNQSNNSSTSNNNATQSENSTPTSTPTPMEQPSPTATPSPTPDNIPFEASWNVIWNGNQVNGVVTANKELKNCWFELWGGSLGIAGSGSISGNSCTANTSANSTKFWMKVESVNGETKEFGDTPPSQGNAQI